MKEELVYLALGKFQYGMKIDLEKIRVIVELPKLRCTLKIRSFHGLTSFYMFIWNFSDIYELLTIKNEKMRVSMGENNAINL
jgi:hypothetical protein